MKHRTVSTGIRMDAKGIHILIEVEDETGTGWVALSGLETMDLIEKLRLLVKEALEKAQHWSQEDWK